MTKKKQLNPFLKLALEMGPLLLFFFANSRPALFLPIVGPLLPEAVSGEKAGIFVATAVFMVAIFVSLAVSYALTRHLPVMALVTALIVVVFGGLTLVLYQIGNQVLVHGAASSSLLTIRIPGRHMSGSSVGADGR